MRFAEPEKALQGQPAYPTIDMVLLPGIAQEKAPGLPSLPAGLANWHVTQSEQKVPEFFAGRINEVTCHGVGRVDPVVKHLAQNMCTCMGSRGELILLCDTVLERCARSCAHLCATMCVCMCLASASGCQW